MRKVYMLLCALLTGIFLHAQTVLINPAGDGGFETASDFAGNGWTVANTTNLNKWFLGTVPGGAGFTSRAAYVSSSATGATWAYDNASISVSHFWRDVTVPAGHTDVTLSFNWQALGETSSYDALMVSVAPTSYTPTGSTTSLSTNGLLAPATTLVQLWSFNTYQSASIKIPASLLNNCAASSTIRLIFTWKNDGSGGSAPPAAIDNISLVSKASPVSAGGTYTIDNTQATGGANFASFTDAINAVNASAPCTPGSFSATFNVTAGQTFAENVPALTASGSAGNLITFQKAGSGANPVITPTGSTAASDFGFALSGSDYVMVNGIDITIASGSAVEYGYLVRNASATDGATNNVIKNSKITLNRVNTSSFGVYQSVSSTQGGVTPTATAGANSNNKYYNITVENAYSGIRLLGNASFPDAGCEVGVEAGGATTIGGSAANDIGNGSGSAYGIYLSSQSAFKVFNCIVRNVAHTGTSTVAGIYIDNSSTGSYGIGQVYNCRVSNIARITSTSSTGTTYGIRADVQATAGNEIKVYNNFIWGLSFSNPSTATATITIRALAGNVSGAGVVSFYHNSVLVNHSTLSHGSAALYTGGGSININNNILANTTPAQASTSKHYAIYRSSGTLSSNSNNLWVANANGFVGFFTTDQASLANWQTATSADGSSININPPFISATDLHIPAGTTTDLESRGAVVGVAFDIDGEVRPGPTTANGGGSAPDIGADEFDGVPTVSACVAPADQASVLTFGTATTATQPGSFTAAGSSPSGYLVVRSVGALNTNPVNGVAYAIGATVGNGTVVSSSSTTSFTATGLTSNTQYTYTVFAYNSAACTGGPIYNTATPLTGTQATCPATPSGASTSLVSQTDFRINWTAAKGGGAQAITYLVEVSTENTFTTGMIAGSPFSVADSTTTQTLMSYTVAGLNPSTLYYYRIRANGCNATYTTIGNVSTLCPPASLPVTEGFNTGGTTVFPTCWSQQTVVGTSSISFQTSSSNPTTSPFEGTRFAYWNSFNITAGNKTRLLSPVLNTTGVSSVDLEFYWRNNNNSSYNTGTYVTAEGVTIQYSVDGGTTWTNVQYFSRHDATLPVDGAAVWNKKSLTLPAAVGNQASVLIGFEFVSALGDNSAMDLVSILPTPTTPCAAPADQATALTFGTTTTTTQPGSFTAAASAPSGYLVVRSVGALNTNPVSGTAYLAGNTLGNGTVIQTGSAVSFSATGLTANTAYTYTVFAYNSGSCIGGPAYNTATPLTGTQATCPATPSSVTVSNATQSEFRLNWTSSKGGGGLSPLAYTVEVATDNVFASPVSGSPFTINDSTTNQTTMRFLVTGLNSATTYYYRIKAAGCNTAYSTVGNTTTPGVPPVNDDATGAISVTVGGGCTGSPYTNANATQGVSEPFPTCKGAGGFNTVWFSFVAPASGMVKISNDYSGGTLGPDTKMSLFSATNVADYSTFNQMACDDDNGSTVGARSIIYAANLTAGTTYYIQVDGYASTTVTGTFCLTVDELTSSMLATSGSCATVQSQSSINTGYRGSLSLVSSTGQLVAIVKDNAGAGGTYAGAVTVNTAAVRQTAGIYYLDRNFRVTNSSASNVQVQFFFLNTELAALATANGATLASLGVVRQTETVGGCYANFATANGSSTLLQQTANGTGNGISWIQATTPGFSNFYIQVAGGSILPANLLTFSGLRQGNSNNLKWTVAQERDVQVYEVQRSTDNRNWTLVGSVNSVGNSSAQRSYNYSDNNASGLRNYYRLRQVDVNGAAKVSNTIAISGNRPTTLALAGLFPNPAASKLNVLIEAPQKDNLIIQVMDAVGKVVRTQRSFVDAGSNTIELNVSGLAQGSYLVKVICENGCQSAVSKFVKE